MNLLLSASSPFPTNVHVCIQFGEFLLVPGHFFHLVGAEIGPRGGTGLALKGVSGRPAEIRCLMLGVFYHKQFFFKGKVSCFLFLEEIVGANKIVSIPKLAESL